MSPAAVEIKTLQIDGRDIGARADQTILEVARENGINIPTLCHLDGLSDVGACRLCLVEIKGSNKLLPACVTRVQEGMEVTAHSPRLEALRKMIVEMLFSERNHVCSVCVSNGHCELQRMAESLGIDACARSLSESQTASGRQQSAVRCGPQPLHSVLTMRPGLRRDRRRAHLGCVRAWD